MSFNRLIIIIGLCCFSLNLSAFNISTIPIETVEQFKRKDSSKNWAIIDIRKPDEFAKGHLPNALNFWRTDYVDTTYGYGGMKASRKTIKELLSFIGVKSTDGILLYDNRGGCEAARFWWVIQSYGHGSVLILDGGYRAWMDNSSTISVDEIMPIQSEYEFLFKENHQFIATLEDIKTGIEDSNTIIIDTRTYDEYTGLILKKGAYKKGRIPTSIHLDWANAINYDGDKKFKSIEELKLIFESKGITKDKNIITYCHSGVRSAHTTFVLTQLLGYSNVKNYDGSWIEWSFNESLPVDSGEVLLEIGRKFKDEVSYMDLFFDSFGAYGNYVWSEITFQTNPWYMNYFWLLIVLSIVVWVLELAFPWRKDQPKIRVDFWIDAFYMFFNFFIFNLVIFIAFCNLTSQVFSDLFGGSLSDLTLINIQNYPEWAQLVIFFVATDFVQWFTHVLLHRFPFLWRFHKIHHSVEQMGFAAHLRYHWMENVFYTPVKYIMVMLIGGFHPEQAFIVYYFAILIGHLNHANILIDYGPLKYILNNPKMHIWHHAYDLPENHKYGVNFGITLSIWDYIFRTNYIPHSGRDIKLGFEKIENFPKTFFKQLVSGFRKTNE